MADNTFLSDMPNEAEEEFAFLNSNLDDASDEEEQDPIEEYEVPQDANEVVEAVMHAGTMVSATISQKGREDVTRVIDDCTVEITNTHDALLIDLILKEAKPPIEAVWKLLKNYGRWMDADIKKGEQSTVLMFSFVPEKYNGHFILAVTNPIFWALTSDEIGVPSDRIRMMFLPDNVGIFEVTANGDDTEEMFS